MERLQQIQAIRDHYLTFLARAPVHVPERGMLAGPSVFTDVADDFYGGMDNFHFSMNPHYFSAGYTRARLPDSGKPCLAVQMLGHGQGTLYNDEVRRNTVDTNRDRDRIFLCLTNMMAERFFP